MGMDLKNIKDKDNEVDLEIGLVNVDDLREISSPDSVGKGKIQFAKFSNDHVKGGDGSSLYCNESNLSGVPIVGVLKGTRVSLARYDSVDSATKTILKEKRKKSGNKKAPKPPRPPRAPSLDAADQKLIREISELAALKRARMERMKALKKMKAAKSTSSSSSCMFSMIFTVVFFIMIIFQGIPSGKSSVENFQGSPVPAGVIEGSVVSALQQLNPSASYIYSPGSDSYNFVQPITNSYLSEKQARETG